MTLNPSETCFLTLFFISFFFFPVRLFVSSPALFPLQQSSVGGDLSLQSHLGVEQLTVALALRGQSTPHLLQLALQTLDHLGEVLQLVGVHPLGLLKGALQALFLQGKDRRMGY